MLSEILVAVTANIVAYYICKWLDSKFENNDQPK